MYCLMWASVRGVSFNDIYQYLFILLITITAYEYNVEMVIQIDECSEATDKCKRS